MTFVLASRPSKIRRAADRTERLYNHRNSLKRKRTLLLMLLPQAAAIIIIIITAL